MGIEKPKGVTRTDMKGLQEINMLATTALLCDRTERKRKLDEHGKSHLRRILCGGCTSLSRLFRMQRVHTPICPFCKEEAETGEEETKYHMW